MQKNKAAFDKKITKYIILFMLFIAAVFYIKQKFFKKSFKHYTEFGIDIPVSYSMHGIDVSHYQEEIDWALVKKMNVRGVGINFAFLKSTEGVNNVDSYFKENMQGCKENGIPRGAYHYFIAARSGKEQAAHFIKHTPLTKGDLAPVLDIEQNDGTTDEQLKTRLQEWLDAVEEEYKIKPIIYCNVEYYNRYITGNFDNYPLWIAHYKVKDRPRINATWAFWQHDEKATISGINTNVDFNAFSGGRWAFNSLLIK